MVVVKHKKEHEMSSGNEKPGSNAIDQGMAKLVVDLLFLDEETCAPCGGTAKALAEAETILKEPLKALGVALEIRKIHVADADIAIAERFLSSPTIRVAGADIDPARTEDDCPSCGTLAGDAISVTCRSWHWRGGVYQAAPVGRIVESVLSEARSMQNSDCSESSCCGGVEDAQMEEPYVMPQNLVSFFEARAAQLKLAC
jgi:hypothetical protein